MLVRNSAWQGTYLPPGAGRMNTDPAMGFPVKLGLGDSIVELGTTDWSQLEGDASLFSGSTATSDPWTTNYLGIDRSSSTAAAAYPVYKTAPATAATSSGVSSSTLSNLAIGAAALLSAVVVMQLVKR